MRKVYTTLIILLFTLTHGDILFGQNTLHVYSTEIPWSEENVEKANGKIYSISEAINSANTGDSIILHEGIYREKVTINKNNLIITNYKSDYVLISGAEIVTGWKNAEGMASGIKEANISGFNLETDYTQLFVNGAQQIMARHPNNKIGKMMEPLSTNSGFASLSNVSKDAGTNANGYATLEGDPIPNVNLQGGIFRGMTGKMRNYVYGDIISNSGNSVTFKAINNGVWKNSGAIKNTQHKFSWGFVMHKNLIDMPGEWYAVSGKLYYMPEAGVEMESLRTEIQVRERVLVLNNTSGVTIKGLNFIAGNADMQSTNNAIIENCTMRYLYPFWTPTSYGQGSTDRTGIYLENSSNNQFRNSYFAHTWGNMIAVKDGSNNQFENCIIEDLGWVGVFTSGIHFNASENNSINNCTFGDAGRFQIRLDGSGGKLNVMDSDFYGAMKMGEDAGPIEATSTGRIGALNLNGSVFAYNKIHDVHGIPVSDGGYSRQKITAFYMEDTENYTAHHNLVYNFIANTYNGPHEIEPYAEFLYLGPRYNAMHHPVNYYNNTIWNVDANISIWNIEIDNWKDLGITPPDTTGMMEKGHFANNIFMNGPDFKMSYVRQKISSTGGNEGYVTLNPSPSFSTTNFDEFTYRCSFLNYHFNPQTNVSYNKEHAGQIFVDADNGNFNLLASAPAKNAGTPIEGITSSANPDCGALEGGGRVLNAGANLQLPAFSEMTQYPLSNKNIYDSPKNTKLYPNPANEEVTLLFSNAIVESRMLSIYGIEGKLYHREWLSNAGKYATIRLNNYQPGMYIVKIETSGFKEYLKLIVK